MREVPIKLAFVALIVSLSIGAVRHASALSYGDIEGRWCTDAGTVTFGRNHLSVTFDDGSPNKQFTITKYNFTENSVEVNWLDDKKRNLRTYYIDFRANGKEMTQKYSGAAPCRTAACPTRSLHRC